MSIEDDALAAATERENEAARRTAELRKAVGEAATEALVRLQDKDFPDVQVQVTKRFMRSDVRTPYWQDCIYTKCVAGLFKSSAPRQIHVFGRLYASGTVLVYEDGSAESFYVGQMTDVELEYMLAWLNRLGE